MLVQQGHTTSLSLDCRNEVHIGGQGRFLRDGSEASVEGERRGISPESRTL